MKYFAQAICIFSFSVTAVSCSSSHHSKRSQAAMPGTWQKTPIVIDGDGKDWPSPYPNYDSKAKVAYATSNDGENLYITMETGDQITQLKILQQGLTVSIDTGGRKEASFHINYPLVNDIDPVELSKKDFTQNRGDQTLYENRALQLKINKSAQDANQLSLEGFNQCTGGFMVKQKTPCGILVRLSIDEYKELVWEAVVPFKAIYNKETITAADAGKPISVCFAVKAFKHATAKDSHGDEGGGSNGGMNNGMAGAGNNSGMNRGGGGRGGGKAMGKGQAEDPMQNLYENTKTWKFFSLAFEK